MMLAHADTPVPFDNFGADIVHPIFSKYGKLDVYESRMDKKPKRTLDGREVFSAEGDWKACVKQSPDGWVRCSVGGTTGWIKRDTFHSAREYLPVKRWPFRFWLHLASTPSAGEGYHDTLIAARKNPYLVKPPEFESVFFQVMFDDEGKAISPRTRRLTGDRVFVFGDAVYLAPDNPEKRDEATWVFLNYYHESLPALCPGHSPASCMRAANTSREWKGVKALNSYPVDAPRPGQGETWFGEGEVAFARHDDPVRPLMYRVPDEIRMRIDADNASEAELRRNREKLLCIADCPAGMVSTK